MFHTIIKIPTICDYSLHSLKTLRIISPTVVRDNMDEYVLLNGLYVLIIPEQNEKSGWLMSYLKTNYGFQFQKIGSFYVVKILIQNGIVIGLKFKGNEEQIRIIRTSHKFDIATEQGQSKK